MKIIPNIKDKKTVFLTILMCIVILSGVVVIFSYSSGLTNYDKYDFVEGIFWVEASAKAKSLISSTFVYSYTVTFGSNVFFMPFYLIFGACLLTNQLGMLLFYFVYLLSLFRLANTLFDSKNTIKIFIIFANMFVFSYIGENLLSHILYYGMGYLCLICQLSCLLNALNHKETMFNKVLFFLSFFVGAINGITIFFSNIASILSFTFVCFLNKRSTNLTIKYIILMVLTTVFGLVIYKVLNINALTSGAISERFNFVNLSTIINNIKLLPRTYFENFYKTTSLTDFNSIAGLAGYIYTAFALSVFAGSLLSIKNYKNINYQIILITSLVIFFVCIGEFALTSQSNMRYLFNVTLSMFLLFAFNATNYDSKKERSMLLYISFLICLLSLRTINTYLIDENILKEDREICMILKENNLNYGFAKYIANYHVLSKGDITGFSFSNNLGIHKYHYEKELLDKTPECDYIFMLVDDMLYEKLMKNPVMSNFERIIVYNESTILVYSSDTWDYIINGNISH